MRRKELVWMVCICLMAMGCKSESHIFNKKEQEELRSNQEALVGQWIITNEEKEEGQILLDFGKGEERGVTLKINNEPVVIETFRMMGTLNFIIQFKRNDGQQSQLLGQFKSYDRNSLMVMNSREVFNLDMTRSVALQKLKMETELTVSIKKN